MEWQIRGVRPRTFALAVLVLTLALAASPATALTTPSTTYAISYDFDGGAGFLNGDLDGAPPLIVKKVNGGAIRTVTHGTGKAIGYPAPCATPDGSSCPRVIIETSGYVGQLNPGTGRIRFGVTIRMRDDQTSDGENVVQKGYATGGSEYKLQVDGFAGRPSCAVVGLASSRIYLAKSSAAIDNGAWHTVSCDRFGAKLSIIVDGVVRGTRTVPSSLKISNSDALRIGGKGTSANNDQFNGKLDDVWVTVG